MIYDTIRDLMLRLFIGCNYFFLVDPVEIDFAGLMDSWESFYSFREGHCSDTVVFFHRAGVASRRRPIIGLPLVRADPG